MNRLFRNSAPGLSGYVALLLFAVAYLGVLAVVFAPDQLRHRGIAPATAALAAASD